MLLRLCLLAAAAVLSAGDWDPIVASPPPKDRWTTYHAQLAKGPLWRVAVATAFGSPDHEEFLAVGQLADGRIAAFGNAHGPAFATAPAPLVLGRGTHLGKTPTRTDAKQKVHLRPENPDCAGFVVLYAPDASAVRKVVRFDWGVASLTTGAVTADGRGLLLSGRATPAFAAAAGAGLRRRPGGSGAYAFDGTACSGDVYVLRLDPERGAIEWAWVLDANGDPPSRLFTDRTGAVWFDAKGLHRISPDGAELKTISTMTGSGTADWLGVDPDGSGAYYGGDRNTRTRREPWRQPYLYRFDREGAKQWTLYEAPPGDVGSDHGGLESDSAVRGMAVLPDGDTVFTGWSDGANTVFQRHADNWKRNCPVLGFGMTPWWPKGANAYAHLMVIDTRTRTTKGHVWWCGYLPEHFADPAYRNRTAGAFIDHIAALPDGGVVFGGRSASGLLQTPGAFWTDPRTGEKYGGSTLVVYAPRFAGLRFSSYLPGCSTVRVAATASGAVAVSASVGRDSAKVPTPSPSVRALSPHQGGTDGHLILLAP